MPLPKAKPGTTVTSDAQAGPEQMAERPLSNASSKLDQPEVKTTALGSPPAELRDDLSVPRGPEHMTDESLSNASSKLDQSEVQSTALGSPPAELNDDLATPQRSVQLADGSLSSAARVSDLGQVKTDVNDDLSALTPEGKATRSAPSPSAAIIPDHILAEAWTAYCSQVLAQDCETFVWPLPGGLSKKVQQPVMAESSTLEDGLSLSCIKTFPRSEVQDSSEDEQPSVQDHKNDEPPSVAKPEQDHNTDEDERFYETAESIWDFGFLWGICTQGADEYYMVVLYLLHVAIQIVFLFIVGNMTDTPMAKDTLENLALWRMIIAHKAEHYDAVTNTSLVTRVCSNSGVMAEAQAEMYKDYASYEAEFGVMLCVMCLFMWNLHIYSDLLGTYDMLRALFSLSLGPRTTAETSRSGIALTEIARFRLICMIIFTIIPKTIVVASWMYVGAQYLAYTPQPADLFPRGIALACITYIDRFLYAHLAPERFKKQALKVHPIRISFLRLPYRVRRTLSFRPVISLMVALLCVALSVAIALAPALDIYAEGRRLLCGGNTNFIFASNAATGLVSIAATSEEAMAEEVFSDYRFRAVLQMSGLASENTLDLDSLTDHAASPPTLVRVAHVGQNAEARRRLMAQNALYSRGTATDVHEMIKETGASAADLLPCRDSISATSGTLVGAIYQASLYEYFGILSCEAMTRQNCLSAKARVYCPQTCFCDNHTSGMFERTGCPDDCEDRLQIHSDRDIIMMRSSPGACRDRTVFADEFRGFFREVQDRLILQGHLLVSEHRTDLVSLNANIQLFFAFSTNFRYWLDPNVSIDLSAWAYESYRNAKNADQSVESSPCKFIEVVYKIFQYDACLNDRAHKLGSLGAICPETCGYCAVDGSTSVHRETSWDTLHDWMLSVANISMIRKISYSEACDLYQGHPEIFEIYMKSFCQRSSHIDGSSAWPRSFTDVFAFARRASQYEALSRGYCRDSTGASAWSSSARCSTYQQCASSCSKATECGAFAHAIAPLDFHDGCQANGEERCVLYIGAGMPSQTSTDQQEYVCYVRMREPVWAIPDKTLTTTTKSTTTLTATTKSTTTLTATTKSTATLTITTKSTTDTASTATDCPSGDGTGYAALGITDATVSQNELHAFGVLRYSGIGFLDGYALDLVITAESGYESTSPELNGKHRAGFGRINVRTCSTDNHFRFTFERSGAPFMMQEFTVTFFDLDRGKADTEIEALRIEGYDWMVKGAELQQEYDGNQTLIRATQRGTGNDNPDDPMDLSHGQASRSVSFYFSGKSGFNASLMIECPGSIWNLNYGRNFLFGFHSSLVDACANATITSP